MRSFTRLRLENPEALDKVSHAAARAPRLVVPQPLPLSAPGPHPRFAFVLCLTGVRSHRRRRQSSAAVAATICISLVKSYERAIGRTVPMTGTRS